MDVAGHLFASDCQAARVYRVERHALEVVAGIGPGGLTAGFTGDGGPATQAQSQCPIGLAFDAAGNLVVVAHGNNRIREIDALGIMHTIAGTGPTQSNQGTFGGDGGPASSANLQEPTFVVIAPDGTIYFSDRDNNRVRRIDTDGLIWTVAGNGLDSFSGDNGPATDAAVDDPAGLAMDAGGNLYVADSNNHRIRRIDPSGMITTIAGSSAGGDTGDEGPASEALLVDPESLAIDSQGNLYVGDPGANRVRRIDSSGVMHAFAGTGQSGAAGDGGPATSATLNTMGTSVGMFIDSTGTVFVADGGNNSIRAVTPDGVITTYAGP